MLAFCAAVILWLLISPDSFRPRKAAGRKPYRLLLRETLYLIRVNGVGRA